MNRRDAIKAALATVLIGATRSCGTSEASCICRYHVEYDPIYDAKTAQQTGIRWHGWVLDPTNDAQKQEARRLMREQDRPGWAIRCQSYTFHPDRIEFDILLEKVFS